MKVKEKSSEMVDSEQVLNDLDHKYKEYTCILHHFSKISEMYKHLLMIHNDLLTISRIRCSQRTCDCISKIEEYTPVLHDYDKELCFMTKLVKDKDPEDDVRWSDLYAFGRNFQGHIADVKRYINAALQQHNIHKAKKISNL